MWIWFCYLLDFEECDDLIRLWLYVYGSCVFVFSLKVGGIFVGLDGVFYVFIGIGRVFGILLL